MTRLLWCLFVLSCAALVWGCSEDAKAPQVDLSPPDVRVYTSVFDTLITDPSSYLVQDSVDTYVGARDLGVGGAAGTVEKLQFYFMEPLEETPTLIGETDTPVDPATVPADVLESIDLPPGWSLYTLKWYTAPMLPGEQPNLIGINSGTSVQFFVKAVDGAGNVSRSPEVVRILVLNRDPNNRPPEPDFVITPSTGSIDTTFTFDPTPTSDRINLDHEIRVRWDFNGDPSDGWDIPWDQNRETDVRADQIVQHKYDRQGIYRVVMECHNTYLPTQVTRQFRDLRVTPPGGDPDPPDPDDFVRVPPGTYRISKPEGWFILGRDAAPRGDTITVDVAELPADTVEIRTEYMISRYETTNELFVNWMRWQLSKPTDSLTVQYVNKALWMRDPHAPENIGALLWSERGSKIFYSQDAGDFEIVAGFEQHPVVNVTWDGADAFAVSYGLRLPTEFEWEVAARGSNVHWDYPFDLQAPDSVGLVHAEGRQRVNYKDARSGGDPFLNDTTPVGFFSGQIFQGFVTIETVSPFGLYDMAGNVAEWVADWYGPYPNEDGRPVKLIDYQGPARGDWKVIRGGSFIGTRTDVRATARRGDEPDSYNTSTGFRCAFNPL